MSSRFKVVLICIGIILIGVMIWPTGDYVLAEAVDGNTVKLNNGATIKLIGCSNTEEGKQKLQKFIGEKILLTPDRTQMFNPDKIDGANVTVYAYVKTKNNNICLNADLLKCKLALLQEDPYLVDSLESFRKYAHHGGDNVQPDVTPISPQVINYESDDIKLPEYVMPSERKHSGWYVNGNENLEMLEEACDYNNPYTKAFANQLAAKVAGPYNFGQVCEIFSYCYSKWRYVNDPAVDEYVARASESIASSLTGDCDDFAVLMASCILAIGGHSRIITASGPTGGHAYTEVDVSAFNEQDMKTVISEKFPQYDANQLNIRNGDGKRWLNLDWQASYPGGPYYNASSWDVYTRTNRGWQWSTNY